MDKSGSSIHALAGQALYLLGVEAEELHGKHMARDRDTRKRSRRDEWGDDAPAAFEEPSFFSRRPEISYSEPSETENVTVLWFDEAKGFGFVQPEEGDKIFLHIRQLEAAGLTSIGSAAELKVVIGQGPKGANVSRIVEVLSTGQPLADAKPRDSQRSPSASSGQLEEASGVVKWYSAEKGFGFIGREDGGKDIFVHVSALKGSGLEDLHEGQAVRVRYAQGAKGLEAKSLKLG